MTERDVPPWDGLVGVPMAAGLLVLVVGLVVGSVAPAASVPGLAGLADEDEAEPPRQIHPDDTASGDLQAIERRWAERLADRARTTDLSADDREAVRDRIEDSPFDRLLDRYSNVSRRTDTEDAAEAYGELRDARTDFYRAYDRYWAAHERYETRRAEVGSDGASDRESLRSRTGADGGPTALYRSAHGVERRAVEVDRTAADLREQYRDLENVTGSDYADSRRTIDGALADVASARAEVREETLRETDLRIDERGANASVRDPLVVSGQVTRSAGGDETGDGSGQAPVANGTVRLITENETAETTTDADGRFDLTYLPVGERTGTVAATVAYVPANASADARASESFEVTVQPAAPDVSVNARPDGVRYDETVAVDGAVTGNGTGLAGIPYFVAVGGAVIADNRTTGPDGRYAVESPLPSAVPTGEQTVRVVVEPPENWSLAPTDGTAHLDVAARQTNLTVTRSDVDDRTVRIAGTLTSRGVPVRNETVAIEIDGAARTTSVTGTGGGFDEEVDVSAQRPDEGPFGGTRTATVSAVFTGSGGNLEPDRDRTTVTVSTPARVSRRAVEALALLGGIGGAGLLVGRRWLTRSGESGGRGPDDDLSGGVD